MTRLRRARGDCRERCDGCRWSSWTLRRRPCSARWMTRSSSAQPTPIVVNVGNFHTLAFQFAGGRFRAPVRAPHGRADPGRTGRLAATRWPTGRSGMRPSLPTTDMARWCSTTRRSLWRMSPWSGPGAALLRDAGLPVYFAVPHGDQMLAGCFGLLRACADVAAGLARTDRSDAWPAQVGPESVVRARGWR